MVESPQPVNAAKQGRAPRKSTSPTGPRATAPLALVPLDLTGTIGGGLGGTLSGAAAALAPDRPQHGEPVADIVTTDPKKFGWSVSAAMLITGTQRLNEKPTWRPAVSLWVAIVVRCGGKGYCWPSMDTLAADVGGAPIRSVMRWSAILVAAGLIVITRRKRRSAIIRLTSDAGFELREVPRNQEMPSMACLDSRDAIHGHQEVPSTASHNEKKEVHLPTDDNVAEDQRALRRILDTRASLTEELAEIDQAEAAIRAKYREGSPPAR